MTSKFRKTVDWEAMRSDWTAGIKSVLQLSEEYEVSRAAILKHWGKQGLERDLAGKIKAKADSLVAQSIVTHQVTPDGRVTEKETIEANALNSATIQINERKDVSKARTIAMMLLDELESQITDKSLYENLAELLQSQEEGASNKLNELFMKVTSFSGRTDNMKKLSDSLKTLIDLERRVYKIDVDPEGDENKKVNLMFTFK